MKDEVWPRAEDDFIELGDTGWVPTADGLENQVTKESMDAEGNLYDRNGELTNEVDDEEEQGAS